MKEQDMLEQFRDFNEKAFETFLWEKFSDNLEVLKAFREHKINKYNDFEANIEAEEKEYYK